MKRILLMVVCLVLLSQVAVRAQEKMVVLPFRSMGVDEISAKTAVSVLRQQIGAIGKYELIAESVVEEALGDATCAEVPCAAELGRRVNASRVVFGDLNRLGEKIIVQYTLVDAGTGKAVLVDQTTALSVEDLEAVMKRVAASVSTGKPVSKTAEVGTIVEKETTPPRHRMTSTTKGVRFGYLYPTKGYNDDKQIFVLDFQTNYETERLMVTNVAGIRDGFAINVGICYLATKTDFCPYLGGGLGFHWVASHSDGGDGFETVATAGLMGFRTYNFRVLMNVDYSVTLNDYTDQAVILTMGVMF